jgi:microcystin-dependent protein
MSDYYVGEIRLFCFDYAPQDFMPCNGQSLSISQYQALYTVIGTIYGGNGQTTFNLPDLRGRSPVAMGQLTGGATYQLGVQVGAETVTLSDAQMPTHAHTVSVATTTATQTSPGPAVVQGAVASSNVFYCNATQAGTTAALAGGSVESAGAGQPHANLQPTVALQYAICVNGLYPNFN